MDECYGIFPNKKLAVLEVLKHLESYNVRKIRPGFYEYSEALSANNTQIIWVMNEPEALLNGFKNQNGVEWT